MFGTPDEICETLEALRHAGAEFIIFAMAGGREHLRRFAREIMPGFSKQHGRRRKRGAQANGRLLERAVPGPRRPCHRRNPLRR